MGLDALQSVFQDTLDVLRWRFFKADHVQA